MTTAVNEHNYINVKKYFCAVGSADLIFIRSRVSNDEPFVVGSSSFHLSAAAVVHNRLLYTDVLSFIAADVSKWLACRLLL